MPFFCLKPFPRGNSSSWKVTYMCYLLICLTSAHSIYFTSEQGARHNKLLTYPWTCPISFLHAFLSGVHSSPQQKSHLLSIFESSKDWRSFSFESSSKLTQAQLLISLSSILVSSSCLYYFIYHIALQLYFWQT